MNLLNSISNFTKNLIPPLINSPVLLGDLDSSWVLLDNGLGKSHTILKPHRFITTSGYIHFPILGSSVKVSRFQPYMLTFSSSSAALNIDSSTHFLNTQSSSNVFASLSDGTYDSIYRGTDGYSFPTIVSSTTISSSGKVIDSSHVSNGYISFVTTKGLIKLTNNTGTAYSSVTAAQTEFTNADCYTIVNDGTYLYIAGGSNGTGKIMRAAVASLNTWTSISNSFNDAISKLETAYIYTDITEMSPDFYRVVGSSRKTVILAGTINGKLGYSLDSGITWNISLNQPFTTGDKITGFANGPVLLYATTSTGKIAVSSNAGANWTLVNMGIQISNIGFAVGRDNASNASINLIGGANGFLAYRTFSNENIAVV